MLKGQVANDLLEAIRSSFALASVSKPRIVAGSCPQYDVLSGKRWPWRIAASIATKVVRFRYEEARGKDTPNHFEGYQTTYAILWTHLKSSLRESRPIRLCCEF